MTPPKLPPCGAAAGARLTQFSHRAPSAWLPAMPPAVPAAPARTAAQLSRPCSVPPAFSPTQPPAGALPSALQTSHAPLAQPVTVPVAALRPVNPPTQPLPYSAAVSSLAAAAVAGVAAVASGSLPQGRSSSCRARASVIASAPASPSCSQAANCGSFARGAAPPQPSMRPALKPHRPPTAPVFACTVQGCSPPITHSRTRPSAVLQPTRPPTPPAAWPPSAQPASCRVRLDTRQPCTVPALRPTAPPAASPGPEAPAASCAAKALSPCRRLCRY